MTAARLLHPDIRRAAFSGELVAWALAYARQGLPVFPAALIDGRKRPLVKIGTGEAHGSLASTDPDQIRAWWTRWPVAMIGMPTGKPSGLVVLDIDRKGGVDGFETMRRKGWTIPAGAVEVVTPSGGAHFYFTYDPDRPTRSHAGKIGVGLDVRGNGGMIILPPSRPDWKDATRDYAYAEGQTPDALGLPMGALTW